MITVAAHLADTFFASRDAMRDDSVRERDEIEMTKSPYASPDYWAQWMTEHDLRRGARVRSDDLIGIAILDVDDDRSVEDLADHMFEHGFDDMIGTVDLVLLCGAVGQVDVAPSMLDIDLAKISSRRLHSPQSFLACCQQIRRARDKADAVAMVLK